MASGYLSASNHALSPSTKAVAVFLTEAAEDGAHLSVLPLGRLQNCEAPKIQHITDDAIEKNKTFAFQVVYLLVGAESHVSIEGLEFQQ